MAVDDLKKRMLQWAHRSNILLFLDSNEYQHTVGRYECLLGVGAYEQYTQIDADFSSLKKDAQGNKDWLMGHLTYDFKNRLEKLQSRHPDYLQFPEAAFFRPQIVCYIPRGGHHFVVESLDIEPEQVWAEICATAIVPITPQEPIRLKKRIEEDDYCQLIRLIKEHIRQGDCYELNFCNEAYCSDVQLDPLAVFHRLNHLSPAPFAAYYQSQDRYMMCASPERYLYQEGNRVLAQPIKGTSARGVGPEADEMAKKQLYESTKERAENVMIVDLMRNDLARFCIPGSVQVDELFGIYAFPQVHQMISSISGRMKEGTDIFDALRYTFPMGSMTGAPKVMVMELIDRYEQARRSLFSGTVGYISPDGNADFNVVIRSLFYNRATAYLSYQTGGAITYDSDPQQEWAETCLKAAAIEKVLGG